jgi:hypothetical protein
MPHPRGFRHRVGSAVCAADASAKLPPLRYSRRVKRVLFILVLMAGPSCRRHIAEFQVRVLYSAANPATEKLRKTEREFTFTDPRLNGGDPFELEVKITNDPTSFISDKTKSSQVDLFLLKSAAELPDVPDLRKSMGDSFSVCGQAVAYIPDWVNEAHHEGAARFLQYLSTHCR